jgi:sugar phosphate permease
MLEIGMIVAGYAVTKYWLPRRGRTISGTARSHVLAGLTAPFVLGALSTMVQGVSTVGIAVLSGATGISIALAHWLVTRRPPREPQPTLEEREKAADLALARALEELQGTRDVIPLPRRERDRQSDARVA